MYLLCLSLLGSMVSFDVVMATNANENVFGPTGTDSLKWWQSGIVYQVYPRSFKDSDGNGIGDLQGVVDKLDYLERLGIGVIWLSPFYKSPMDDMGYDISNFTAVDPLFGDLNVFDTLVKGARSRGLKIIVDFVPGHVSTQHDWFQRSANREDPYTDYFNWQDAKNVSGVLEPPNNWLSVFGGTAWGWNEQRQQYFYHAFLNTQANLNYRSDYVRTEMKNVLRFWLDRGVDGFRVDAISHLYQVDNVSLDEPSAGNNLSDFNYASQQHIYQEDRPEILPIVTSWVQLLNAYQKKDGKVRYLILETYANTKVRSDLYGAGGNPFNFDLTGLNKPITGYEIRDKIVNTYAALPAGKWPNFVLGNHDVRRISQKFGSSYVDVFNMLLLTLWGTPTTYQGEEIAMIPPEISWEQTVDPWGRNYGKDHYKEFTRDYQRSPMQWDDSKLGGFTSGNSTWLPVAKSSVYLNVKTEESSNQTTHLKLYRRLAALRQRQAFQVGRIKFSVATQNVLSYIREGKPTRYLVALNIGEITATNDFQRATGDSWGIVVAVTSRSKRTVNSVVSTQQLTLGPGEGLVIHLIPATNPIVGK